MKDWNYRWVEQTRMTENQADTISVLPFMYIYVRVYWERHLDGMSVPRTEILGYVQFNQALENWELYLHEDTITSLESKGNHLSAMLEMEKYFSLKALEA